MIAVILLSGALVVLIGLQTSSVSRTIRDRDQQAAMLVARSILSAAAMNPGAIPSDVTEQSAYELLQTLVSVQSIEEDFENAVDYRAITSTEDILIPLPTLPEPLVMQRFTLELSWGDLPDERLTITYFIPSDIKGDQTEIESSTPEENDDDS